MIQIGDYVLLKECVISQIPLRVADVDGNGDLILIDWVKQFWAPRKEYKKAPNDCLTPLSEC